MERVLSTSRAGIVVNVIHCSGREKSTLQFRWANCTFLLKEVADAVPQVCGDAQYPIIGDRETQVEQSVNQVSFASLCVHQHSQVHRQWGLPIVAMLGRLNTCTLSAAGIAVEHEEL